MTWQSDEPCVACGTMSVDRCYHHIYTRKAKPELINEKFNLMSLCSTHHVECHAKGLNIFSMKYHNVKDWLFKNDWYICELKGTWKHD